jgi:hypothetical protein
MSTDKDDYLTGALSNGAEGSNPAKGFFVNIPARGLVGQY